MTAGEAGNDGPAYLLGDAAHRLGVGRGGDRKPGFDDVHPERVQLARELELLLDPKREARRLLAVTQSGIENPDSICSHAAQ